MENQIIIIFGASGDLTKRKLIPALYLLNNGEKRSGDFVILGVGRTNYSDSTYRAFIKGQLEQFLKPQDRDDQLVDEFSKRVFYLSFDPENREDYLLLRDKLNVIEKDWSASNYLYYFSTPPKLYNIIPANLSYAGLTSENKKSNGYRRVIVEKPFGYNLQSSRNLSNELKKYFPENQIFRIDHFLGKETVQNILALRFANGIFEPLWNRNYIDRVEITAVENRGIEQRGAYYEEAGALRDMVQNHLIQFVALCAMEPPVSFNEKDFRDEVVKVYKSIKPLSDSDIEHNVVRGQYISSDRGGEVIQGYREESKVDPKSMTETFLAMKLEISNWRWDGVPFYIRTGKQMPTKVTEIVIHFKETPHYLFDNKYNKTLANQLIIRIQPNEGIVLKFGLKVPGSGFEVKPVSMDFTYDSLGGIPTEDAYSRLIEDCMAGDPTLFTRSDAVEASWNLFDSILEYWKKNPAPLYGYPAGTWGPLESESIVKGSSWTNPCKNLTNTDLYCEL